MSDAGPDDCLFCKIVAGEVPATKLREDELTLAFADVNPQAPVHILVIPKKHLPDVVALGGEPETAAAVLAAIKALTEEQGIGEFRTVFNTGAEVGQSVFHVHAHVLSGRRMTWPPG
jgi:histidine triad (HIT) family protein